MSQWFLIVVKFRSKEYGWILGGKKELHGHTFSNVNLQDASADIFLQGQIVFYASDTHKVSFASMSALFYPGYHYVDNKKKGSKDGFLRHS